MRRRQKQDYLETFKNKLYGYSGLILFILVFVFATSLIRNIFKAVNIRKRIGEEKEKIEELQREKEEFERKVAEAESEAFIEKQLRDKLGFAKEGEVVLILPDDETLKKLVPISQEEENFLPDPTWKKWLNLFL